MEKKAKVQDCVHNYLKSKGTTHPINHCECNSDVCYWWSSLSPWKCLPNPRISCLPVTATTELHNCLPQSCHDLIFWPTAFFFLRWGEECRKGLKALQVSVAALTNKHETCRFGKHFHGISKLHQSETSLLHYRIVGSVVLSHNIRIKLVFLKTRLISYGLVAPTRSYTIVSQSHNLWEVYFEWLQHDGR